MSQVFSPRIYSPIQSELFPSEKATPQAFTRGVFLLDLTLSARLCVGVSAGQPVEEALDFKIPEAPLVPVLLDLIPRHLAAELDQAVAELDVRLIQEILLSAGEIALGELLPFGSKLFGKRGRSKRGSGSRIKDAERLFGSRVPTNAAGLIN